MTTRRQGRIVSISSGASLGPWPNVSAYAISKAAPNRFSETLALEVADDNITVFSLNPGLVRTAMTDEAFSAEWKKWDDQIPRLFEEGDESPPEMAAQLTVALASGKADILTGRLISISDDFLGRLAQGAAVRDVLGRLFLLRSPDEKALAEILTRPVAAKDYWDKGRIRRYIARNVFDALLIDRKEIKVHNSPVDMMLREIGTRQSLIIFPEGGRSTTGEMGDFKSGLYYLSKKRPELELVPVHIDNLNRVLPRGEFLPVPLLSCISFGPPIWLEQGELKADFLKRAREAVRRLKDV
jgi:hypothetical protein